MNGYGAATSVRNLRCWQCRRLIAELVTPPYQIRCRCKAVNARGVDDTAAPPAAAGVPPVRSAGWGGAS